MLISGRVQLDLLGKAMSFVYFKVPGPTPKAYSMDHSASMIVIDPQARVGAYLTPPFDVGKLVADFEHLIPPAG